MGKATIPLATRRAVALRYGCKPGCSCGASCHYCGAQGRIHWATRCRRLPGYPERLLVLPGYWVSFSDLDLDHVVPAARNGSGAPENIVLACPHCNRSKGARSAPKERR